MALTHSPQIVTRNLLLNLDFGNIQKCYNGSENLLTYSEQFDNAAWTQSGVSVSANTSISPIGTTTADKIIPSASSTGFKELQQNFSIISGTTYTFSHYLKSDGYRYVQIVGNAAIFGTFAINYDLNTGTETAFSAGTSTVVGRGIESIGNGWYRVYASVTALSTSSGRMAVNIIPASDSVRGFNWTGDGTSGVLFWGAQLERGRSPSPYVATTTSTVTRPTTATSTISNYSHTINRPEYISYDAANNSIRFDRNETFANFTGSISGTVLTVSAVSSGTIVNGMALSYSGVTPPLIISSFGTGTGGAGTYNLSANAGTVTSRAMTGAYKIGGNMNVTTSGSLASNTYLYNDHTTEVWARINDINAANYDGYEAWNVLTVFRGYHSMFIYTPSIGLRYDIWDNTGPTNKSTTVLTIGTSGTDIIQGQWFNVVVTKSGTTFKTYLNGTLRKTDTITSTAFSGVSNDLRLGGAGDGNTGSFYYYAKNNVGCLKMYNAALSADEISQNFNALRGRYGI